MVKIGTPANTYMYITADRDLNVKLQSMGLHPEYRDRKYFYFKKNEESTKTVDLLEGS